jgi:3-oxoacyl-[acyl-carrier protein] reductase
VKTVLVTGGSRGLGLGIVRALLDDGYGVATCSRNPSSDLQTLLDEERWKSCLKWMPFQVGHDNAEDFVEAAAKWAEERGSLYGLVNNAGIAREGVLATFPVIEIERTLQVNLCGALQMARACLRIFLRRQTAGRIINISSIIGSRGYAGLAAYSASKAGMDGMTRALAREVGRRSITVNSIAPGYLKTELSSTLSDVQLGQIANRTPMRRLGTVDDVSPILLFLLGDGARFITGQTLCVDGGLSS